ncbi:CRM1 C terminal-domain-containing protein [Histomonas meleagridis]|uniref:CRM1 C terminal-domain-containing protein n=1 Tax=Histomonas meleagridis TaxID=135588 RepID=UPI00355AA456|nr:CRM1 C terminal-domain-containing protein [Histomonas meleagridis]KAH0802368.1 CRM1 C terminal-domain-containing protein [Histomonas meleagridis]
MSLQDLINAANNFRDPTDVGNNARQFLDNFKQNPTSYQLSPQIISAQETPPILKFIAIQTLQDLIRKRWGQVQEGEKQNIRGYIMNMVHSYSSQEGFDQTILTQMNMAFVYLLIQEWPSNFPTIIEDLMNGSTTPLLCSNSLDIINLFCQESLEDTEETLTYARSNQLAASLQEHAQNVFSFVEVVMTNSQDREIILKCLKTLQYFIKWIPPMQIIGTQLFQQLCRMFLPQQDFVTEVLFLIGEVFSLNDLPQDFCKIAPQVFLLMVQALDPLLPEGIDFNELLQTQKRFINVLPFTLTVFLDKFGSYVETPDNVGYIQRVLQWFCLMSILDDDDTLKTCCEFWLAIARRSFNERNNIAPSAISTIYLPFMPHVRRILIQRMQRPEEIIIVKDETGQYVREQQRNTLTLMLHAIMKECLVFLTNLDNNDTIQAIEERLSMLGQQWDPDVCNSICWSVGAITCTFSLELERKFVSHILLVLLDMCSRMPDPNNRAIIASGIMYICSQYPRFLSKHPDFIHTVVEKLFEFMHQDVEGVKEMAVNSFRTIASKCRKQFLSDVQFVYGIYQNFPQIASDLSPDLQLVFIDAISILIQGNYKEQTKLEQLHDFLQFFNERWDQCMASFNPQNILLAQEIAFLLQCNATIALNLGKSYHEQMKIMFPQIINVYSSYSQVLPMYIQQRRYDEFRIIKAVRSAVLTLIKNFFNKTHNVSLVASQLMPDIMNVIVLEYGNSHPEQRVSEVLQLLTVLFNTIPDIIRNYVPQIFDSVFQQTVMMINNDFDQNVSFRLPFYQFLSVMIKNSMNIIISAPAEVFNILIQTINWGVSHPTHEVCTLSINITSDLLKQMSHTQVYGEFLDQYYLIIIFHLFETMIDTIHKFAFEEQINLLSMLLSIQTPHLNPENITKCILGLFPQRDPNEIFQFICALISTSNDKMQFRRFVRDFLVSTRQFNATDPDLYRTENAEIDQMNQKNLNAAMNTEGMEDFLS